MNLTTGIRERVRTWLPRNELLRRMVQKLSREKEKEHPNECSR
jgi:hypothetical protein